MALEDSLHPWLQASAPLGRGGAEGIEGGGEQREEIGGEEAGGGVGVACPLLGCEGVGADGEAGAVVEREGDTGALCGS